jgi:hypothetical protein
MPCISLKGSADLVGKTCSFGHTGFLVGFPMEQYTLIHGIHV